MSRRLLARVIVQGSGDMLAPSRQAAGDGSDSDLEMPSRLFIRESYEVNSYDRVTIRRGRGGDRRHQLARAACARPTSCEGEVGLEHWHGRRPPRGGATSRDVRISQRPQ
jgi:hypothetical protein